MKYKISRWNSINIPDNYSEYPPNSEYLANICKKKTASSRIFIHCKRSHWGHDNQSL